MKSNSIEMWSQDGLIIASRYKQKIAEEGINSPKSLGERTSEKDWKFYSLLFENVSIKGAVSILDIGCGKAELLDFLKNNYSELKIDRYLGLDLVEEFLDVAQLNYPEYEFQLQNFISDQFLPNQTFDLVVALGVLISRVNNYQEFVEYFIRKMVRWGSGHILFNLISEIDLSSQNYLNHNQVGHSTSFSRTALESILDKIDNTSYQIVESKIFPDATDMFIHIVIEKEK
ncbi:MAG: class I SAM-dependent methyltransferase [Xenococcaceae cyanobacterium MO_188.B29]|nr:class I SAM-dependent methyltransferase [Xenococcaceae cyanobacterium MO_188.B29]